MLSNSIVGLGGGDGIIVSSFLGIGDMFGTSSGDGTAPVTSSNNNNVDGLLVAGSSSTIPDSIITFSPVKDAELRRRARNNAILAKIQELEANASVQTARSERLRMMREEYESLVRKYASSRKWAYGQGSSTNGVLNENNSYHQATYLSRHNSQHQPLIFANSQPLLATTSASGSSQGWKEIDRTSATIGVNTDITGPVRPADVISISKDDLARSANLERKRVKVVLDTSTQTVEVVQPPPPILSSQGPFRPVAEGKKANQNDIVSAEKDNKEVSQSAASEGKQRKATNKSPRQMELLLLEDDDESLRETHERIKVQEQYRDQLKHPKGTQAGTQVDENSSNISSPPSVSSLVGEVPTSSNTEEIFKLGRKQEQQQKQLRKEGGEKSTKSSQRSYKKVDKEESSKIEDSSANYDGGDKLRTAASRYEITDPSFSDSISLQRHDHQRQKLLEKVVGLKASRKDPADDADGEENTLNDSNTGDDELGDKSFENEDGESRRKKGTDCSSPITGATSESIEDSLMESIHKTPDALLRDDSELQGIAEGNEEEQEEIELDDKVSLGGVRERSGKEGKSILTQRGVNEELSNEPRAGSIGERRELLAHRHHHDEEEDGINDAEEIRSNNLSSSKLDVLFEEENFTHANNPFGETLENARIKRIPLNVFGDNFVDGDGEQTVKNSFYDNFRQLEENNLFQVTNEFDKRSNLIYSTAPSANMSPSSIPSAFTSVADGGNEAVVPKDEHTSISPPATTSFLTRQISGESSSSSSQHQPFEEHDMKNNNLSKTIQETQSSEGDFVGRKTQQSYLPTSLPQAVNNFEEQIEKQDKKASTRERLTSSFKSGKNVGVDNNEMVEEGATTLVHNKPASFSPTALKKKGESNGSPLRSKAATNSNGTGVNLSGSNEGSTNNRSGVALKASSGIQPMKPSPTTVPSGKTGALNTAKRVRRLKYNEDDSTESDSSEIGLGKAHLTGAPPTNIGGVRSQVQDSKFTSQGLQQINEGKGETEKVSGKKEDDDFDEFFDI